MQIDKKDIIPITNILGLAVLDAQRLEYSIAYMMLLVDDRFDFTNKTNDNMIDDFMLNLSKKTLGGLITKMKELIKVSDGFSDRLNDALEARNYLTHRFFNDQADNLITIEGRKNALRLVREKRKTLYECYFFLDPFIRLLMEIRGFSADDFLEKIEEKYETKQKVE